MNTKKILNRAYAHWLKDGFAEIGAGIFMAGVGALRAIIHFAGAKTAAYYWLSIGLLAFMIVVAGGGGYVVKLLKTRVTYPRTGYTAFKPYPYKYRSMLALFIAGGILGGVLGVLSTQPNEQWIGIFIPIGQGIVAGIVFSYAALRLEEKRFYYLAAFSIVIGILIGALGVGLVLGLSFFYLSIGLALIVTGSVGLVQYLRGHAAIDLKGEKQ